MLYGVTIRTGPGLPIATSSLMFETCFKHFFNTEITAVIPFQGSGFSLGFLLRQTYNCALICHVHRDRLGRQRVRSA